jgi:archaellin
MTRRIQLRRDTTANWEGVDPVLAAGEIGVDLTTGQIKIGDGSASWTELDYYSGSDVDLTGLATEQYVDDAVKDFITAADIPTDFKGSVFADDSTLLVDGVNASIPYSVLSDAPTIPSDINQRTDNSG